MEMRPESEFAVSPPPPKFSLRRCPVVLVSMANQIVRVSGLRGDGSERVARALNLHKRIPNERRKLTLGVFVAN